MASPSRKSDSNIPSHLFGGIDPEEIPGAPYNASARSNLNTNGPNLMEKHTPELAHPSAPAKEIIKTLQDAEKIYTEQVSAIHQDIKDEKKELIAHIEAEKQRLLNQLEAKKNSLISSAKKDYEATRKCILDAAEPTSQQPCSLCFMPKPVLAAICIDCGKTQLCSSCLTRCVKDSCKCSNCGEVTNFICNNCEDNKLREVGWFSFDECRNGCGSLCPEHIRSQECCKCGSQSFCYGPKRRCKINKCGNCGRVLCNTCKVKEGCVCGEYYNGSWFS